MRKQILSIIVSSFLAVASITTIALTNNAHANDTQCEPLNKDAKIKNSLNNNPFEWSGERKLDKLPSQLYLGVGVDDLAKCFTKNNPDATSVKLDYYIDVYGVPKSGNDTSQTQTLINENKVALNTAIVEGDKSNKQDDTADNLNLKEAVEKVLADNTDACKYQDVQLDLRYAGGDSEPAPQSLKPHEKLGNLVAYNWTATKDIKTCDGKPTGTPSTTTGSTTSNSQAALPKTGTNVIYLTLGALGLVLLGVGSRFVLKYAKRKS